MDSLKIQDVFEPYYAGRKRFAAPKDSVPSEKGNRQSQKPVPRAPAAEIRLSDNEPDSTTEH